MVLRAAQLLTSNTADAEDLAQEALMKAFSGIASFKPIQTAQSAEVPGIRSWLLTILRRTHIDRLRAAGSRIRTESLEGVEGVAVPAAPDSVSGPTLVAQDVLEQFSDEKMISALCELPDDQRWTLLLADIEGLDHSEVAKVLDVAVGTVKSRVHRARAELREKLAGMVAGSRGAG
jgi:RNA polymerase sigma-70 factor, ECF subfamily